MLTKRFFLIAGGTVGGLGAVLSITPPQFGSTSGLSLGTGTSLSGGTTSLASGSTGTTSTPASTPTPAATKKATTTTTTTTKKSTKTTTATTTPKATPAATTAAPKPAGVSGTFTGASANTVYGPVQVQITVSNGKITNAVALTYPTGSFRDQQINQQAIPYLIQETLAAQSANIQGVGGASYTSQGWVDSLQSALSKAGL